MKKQKIKKNKRTKKIISKILAGVLSPGSASKKIQNKYRSHSISQNKKVSDLEELLSKGVSVYRNSIQNIDFRGVNMSHKVLSQKVFKKAKFQNVNFKQSKFNSTKLQEVLANKSNFEKCEFKNAKIKESTFQGANFELANLENLSADLSNFNNCRFLGTGINLKKGFVKLKDAKFLNCEIKNSLFKFCDLHYTRFFKSNLQGSEFVDNKSKFDDGLPIFTESNLDYVSFIDNPIFFTNIKSSISESGEKDTIKNFKIINTKQHAKTSRDFIIYDEFDFNKFVFNNLKMINLTIRNGGKFNDCTFNKLELDNVQFYKIKFNNCTFIDSNFSAQHLSRHSSGLDPIFIGHSNIFTNCLFKNCNLSESDVRACNFSNSTFSNCNMNRIKIEQSILLGVKFNEGTILTNINFQHCTDMEGMNFRGLDLQNSIFGAADGQNLRGCDFRDANLQGTQFAYTQIHGSNFTGANLNGSTVRQAEGSQETVGIPADLPQGRATDTHQAFYNIRINKLLDFYIYYVTLNCKTRGIKIPTPYTNSRILTDSLFTIFKTIIDHMDNDFDKEKLMRGLNSCFKERLDHYDFDQIIAGTDPPITFTTLISWVLFYLIHQSEEFKNLYLESLITDSTQAHGANGLSCAAGIIERFVTVMEQVASVLKDSVPEKKEEYEELIGIIENDPQKLIKKYMEEWFDIHKEGGEDEYREDTDKDILMKSYKEFLEEKFDVKNLRGDEKEKIEKLIIEHPDAGVDFLRNQIGVSFFFGGRKTRRYHKNTYSKKKTKKYRTKISKKSKKK